MNRWLLAQVLVFAVATSLADVTKGGFGAEKDSKPSAESESNIPKEPKDSKRNSYPFHGTLGAIDSSGTSLTLEGKKKPRVIAITAETRIFRDGAKAKLKDGVAGERVTGTVRRNAAGQEEAVTVRFSQKTPPR